MKLAIVEILHPEGSVVKFSIDQANVDNLAQTEGGTAIVKLSNGDKENYPEHRVHKTVWRPGSE